MPTYDELMAQAEALRQQAQELLKQERAGVIADIRAKMAKYGISAEELASGARGGRKRGTRAKAVPKYRGPNGETWSGGPGRKPGWVRAILDAGGDIEQYRVAS